MLHPSLRAVVVAVAAAAMFPGAGAAQDASPVAAVSPTAAAVCTVEPRSSENLRGLLTEVLAAPVGSFPAPFVDAPAPLTPPTGVPADAETVVAVTAVAQDWLLCQNGESLPAVLALYTDQAARGQLGRAVWSSPAAAALQAGTPVPAVADALLPLVEAPFDGEATVLIGVRDVVVREDGRVGAIVTWSNPERPNDVAEFAVVFRLTDGRYRIDGGGQRAVQRDAIPPATPTP